MKERPGRVVRVGSFLEVKEESLFGLLIVLISSFLLIIVVMLSHILSHEEGSLIRPDSFAKSFYLRHHHLGNESGPRWNDVKDSFIGGDIDLGMVISGGGKRIHSDHEKEKGVVKRRKKVAYAITITKDGFFQDGAAVLAWSIIKQAQHSRHDTDISLVAFVHPLVVEARPKLRKLGFHVIEAPMPINITAIEHKFLREKINLNGCCGASELIKLNAYRLLQYDNVVHMDADTMVINPINEILHTNYSLVYTTDPNMATHKGEDKMPAQGGFLVLKPSETDFRAIIDTLMTTKFVSGGAWNGTKIGWFWGGMTVQGILPYYYNKVTVPNVHRRKIVDRCVYNTMADTKMCEEIPFSQVKTAHFTICQKPWACYGGFINKLCEALHKEWFRLRKEAERFYGVQVTEGACEGPRGQRYKRMKLEDAQMPQGQGQGSHYSQKEDDMLLPIPDESADLFEPPFPESRYTGHVYDNHVGGHVNKPRKKKPAPPRSSSSSR